MYGRILLLLALLFSQPVLAVDTLDKIRKSGVISIAHPANTPPFSYMKGGEPTGYSINLCRHCLLYTSPSPRDGLLSRMPSSA